MVTRSKVKDLLKAAPGQEVLAKGWVRTKRGNKQIKFIALNDGSTVNNIQVVVDMANFDEAIIAKITTGASISVTGDLIESVGSGQAVEIKQSRSRCSENATLSGTLSRRRTLLLNISAQSPTFVRGQTRSEQC